MESNLTVCLFARKFAAGLALLATDAGDAIFGKFHTKNEKRATLYISKYIACSYFPGGVSWT